MGYTTYYVSYNSAEPEVEQQETKPEVDAECTLHVKRTFCCTKLTLFGVVSPRPFVRFTADTVSIQNSGYTVSFSTSTGRMISILNKYTGQVRILSLLSR